MVTESPEDLTSSIGAHLKLLGYVIEPLGGHGIGFGAKHPNNSKLFFHVNGLGVLFTMAFHGNQLDKGDHMLFCSVLNAMNAKSAIGKYYTHPEHHGLWCEAQYSGPFDEIHFGAFFGSWTSEIQAQTQAGEEALRPFLMQSR